MSAPPVARVLLARLGNIADEGGSAWLTEREAERLAAMSAPARRRSFLAGHWQARVVAADWLQVDMRRIALHRHDDGRPQLVVDGAPSDLSLSLSHSGDWLAIALATVPVGIDVEFPRRARDLPALARFTFSPEEIASLDGLDEAAYGGAFHRLWTLKEARGKRLGEGLLPGRSRRVTALPSDPERADATSWELDAGALSLAIEPGARVDVIGGESLNAAMWWRYREQD